jgi:hypothetical protein
MARAGASNLAAGARLALVAALAAGCGGTSPSSGLTAYLRVSFRTQSSQVVPAQFVPGPLATVTDATKPTVDSVAANSSMVYPGAVGRGMSGRISGTGTAILVGLPNDSGHWVVPAGTADIDTPGDFSFDLSLSYSPELPLGDTSLVFRAVDAQGVVGPAYVLPLTVFQPIPAGALVVSLSWDTESDLDLHVQVPNVNDPNAPYYVWSRNPVALPPRMPGDPLPTADEIAAAGQLDFDSNAACVIDGRRQENLVFPNPPPSGAYQVKVDAFSLCGQATARWQAVAVDGSGNLLGQAFGQLTDVATQGSHLPSSGLLAFGFSIP